MLQEEHSQDNIKKQFAAALMRGGKRATAENILKGALLLLKDQGVSPTSIFLRALNRSAPLVEVIGKNRGRTKIMVPRSIETKRRLGFAIKWIVTGARMRTESSMVERLAYELLSLSKGQGDAIRKKSALHQLTFKNRNNTYMR
tara:strand:- start:1 stop:432 length:432 start_codon:yes stop_codon:yes gene_type:complete